MLLVLFRSLVVLFLILRVLTCMRMVAFLMQTVPFCMLGGVARVPTVAVEQNPAARGPVKQNPWQTESLAKEASVKQNQTDGAFLYAGRCRATCWPRCQRCRQTEAFNCSCNRSFGCRGVCQTESLAIEAKCRRFFFVCCDVRSPARCRRWPPSLNPSAGGHVKQNPGPWRLAPKSIMPTVLFCMLGGLRRGVDGGRQAKCCQLQQFRVFS